MALENDDFDIDQLKWVVLMVLFNQPGEEAAYTWLEDMVFENMTNCLH
jgi:Smg protein